MQAIRPSNHRPHPSVSSISRPIPAGEPIPLSPPMSPNTKPVPLATKPGSPPKVRRPSVSNPMQWLARTSSTSSARSAPYAPSKPVRISEPRFANPVEAIIHQRSGTLGTGATVVRTPQEALSSIPPPAAPASPPTRTGANASDRHGARSKTPTERLFHDDHDRPGSPPLPPIPDADADLDEVNEEEEDEDDRLTLAGPESEDWHSAVAPSSVNPHPSHPTRPPPSLPSIPDFDSEVSNAPAGTAPAPHSASATKAYASPPLSDYFPPVPPLPAGLPVTPPQPPFDAILMSPMPNTTLDPAKIVVALETSTATHRTTMATLVSRPSFLADYLLGLFPTSGEDVQSVYSTASDADSSFNSIFQHHIASSGVLMQTSSILHIFLDRPSASYAHILTYLRSPASTPEHPVTLPHAIRLNGTSCRLEALLELRDEACYLGLDELQRLCSDELRQRACAIPSGTPHAHGQSPSALGLHMRGFSNGSNPSVRSLHTLKERDEGDKPKGKQRGSHSSDDSGFESPSARKSAGSADSHGLPLEAPWPSPPGLKQRAALAQRERKDSKMDGTRSLRARPSGDWI